DGEQFQLHLEVAGREDERKSVEEQRAVVRRVERHQMPAQLWLDALVKGAKIGRLSRQSGAVVDDLERQLALPGIELHAAVTLPDARPRGLRVGPPAFRSPSVGGENRSGVVSPERSMAPRTFPAPDQDVGEEIGRASCRER